MIKRITRRRLVAASLACAAVLPVLAMAQPDAWPNRPVRMLVPFPPGGGADFVARLVGQRLSELWRQPVYPQRQPQFGRQLLGTRLGHESFFIAGQACQIN